MRDEHDRFAQLPLQRQELVLHLLADQRVQRAERLVHQQDLGVRGQRAGEADALAHPAGKLTGQPVLPSGEPDHLQRFGGAFALPLARSVLHAQPVGDVLRDRAVREQREVLEHHAHPPLAQLAHLSRGLVGQVDVVDQHPAGSGREQSVQRAQQGRLARTGQSHHHENFAALHGEGGVDHRRGHAGQLQFGAVGAVLQLADRFFRPAAEHFVQLLHTNYRHSRLMFSHSGSLPGDMIA